MHSSFIISELARLHGEDLRRDAENRRRSRPPGPRRQAGVAARLRALPVLVLRLVRQRPATATTHATATALVGPYADAVPAFIPRQAGPRDVVSPLLDATEPAEGGRGR